MGQVITRIEDIGNVSTLVLSAGRGYVRNSGNSAWEVRPFLLTDVAQFPNTFYAGPGSGGSAAPTFRGIDGLDLPTYTTNLRGAVPAPGAPTSPPKVLAAGGWQQIDFSYISGTLGIGAGGTGQVTANAAFNALAPAQGSQNGKFLTTNGTDTSWSSLSFSNITGTLGISAGGTGQTTANAAFNALAPSQGSQSGKFLTTNGTDTSWASVTVPTGANPTTNVTLTASNGSAATFMRSDGAPALSQAIAPTWTAGHTFSPSGTSTVPVIVNATSGQTADLMDLKVNGTIKALVNPSGAMVLGGSATDANHTLVVQSVDNTANHGLKILSNNTLAQIEYGYGTIIGNVFINIAAGAGNTLSIGGNAGTQMTLSGTLISTSCAFVNTPVALTISASHVATNAALGNKFKVASVNGNFTLDNPTNPTNGQVIQWTLKEDATGGRTCTFDTKFLLGASGKTSPLTLSGANKIDVITAYYDSTEDKYIVMPPAMGA